MQRGPAQEAEPADDAQAAQEALLGAPQVQRHHLKDDATDLINILDARII
jgi:hypothetical protein